MILHGEETDAFPMNGNSIFDGLRVFSPHFTFKRCLLKKRTNPGVEKHFG